MRKKAKREFREDFMRPKHGMQGVFGKNKIYQINFLSFVQNIIDMFIFAKL